MKHKNDELPALPYLVDITPSRLEILREWWRDVWPEFTLIGILIIAVITIVAIAVLSPTPVEVYEHAYKDCIVTERHTEQECHEIALFDVADD